MRYAAGVEYQGTRYAGWQRQHHAVTVQGEVERALSKIANEPIEVICAGRTDSGVHGLGQVIHFDSEQDRNLRAWCQGTNTHLPADISLRWVKAVDEGFSARYSALSRHYRYLIIDGRTRSGLFGDRVYWSRYSLDHECMHEAAQSLLGEQDFSSFRAAACQSHSPMRNVMQISVQRRQAFLAIDIQANAFVHHMVRNIAGALMAVGSQQRPIEWMAQLLAVKDRTQAGVTAPAHGLYFMSVDYPSEYAFPVSDTANLLSLL